jgi:hypothetical protein
MHSNNNLALGQPLPLAPVKPAGIWAQFSAFIADLCRPSRPVSAVTAHVEHAAAPVDVPLYVQEFVTEREALAYSASALAQGCRTIVEQSVYDYSWHVEVYAAPAGGERA